MLIKYIYCFIVLAYLIAFNGCAEVEMDKPSKKQTAVGRNWTAVSVNKSSIGNADVTLAVKTIELQAGETPEQAVFRVFGSYPGNDIRQLLSAPAVSEQYLEPGSTSSTSICNDSCIYANDGLCDEPNYCSSGTDCSDCGSNQNSQTTTSSGSSSTVTCQFVNDGICDEPTYCPVGTDTADCANQSSSASPSSSTSSTAIPDSCRYARDGYCDEPNYCAVGTDTTDCQGYQSTTPPSSSSNQNQSDPSNSLPSSTSTGPDSCT